MAGDEADQAEKVHDSDYGAALAGLHELYGRAPTHGIMAGMERAFTALMRGIASQFRPAMLGLLVVPVVVALVFWIGIAWFAWDPLNEWLRGVIFGASGVMHWIDAQSVRLGFDGMQALVASVVALLLLLPMPFVTALVVIGVMVMPVVTRQLGNRAYPDVMRRGSWSVTASVWNAVSSVAIFIAGYLLTTPLWLIPPLAIVVPWLWWSWLTARIMRFDSLVEHADPAERRALIAKYRRQTFLLAGMLTVLNYIPPLFLLTPVLSALAFVHFSLAALRAERGGGVVPR